MHALPQIPQGESKLVRFARASLHAPSVVLMLSLAGCGPSATPPAQAPAPVDMPAPEETLTMQGIDLYLHETAPTPGAPRKPTFWVHAEQFSMLEDDVWRFDQARAVIYGDDAQQEAITLEADRGRFEEDRGALLEGSVKAYVNDMKMELSDIEWVNPQNDEEEGVARSDQPVRVESPTMQLKADNLRLYPERKQFVLTEVSGHVRFGRTPQ